MDSDKSNQPNASKYISEHKLEPILTEMLNTLVYEKDKRPEIFMIKYLSSLLKEEDRVRNGIHVAIPENFNDNITPLVKFPDNKHHFVSNHLSSRNKWDKIKYKQTKYKATINDLLKNEQEGITITDPDCFNVFKELVTSFIHETQAVNLPLRIIEKQNNNITTILQKSKNIFENKLMSSAKFTYYRNLHNLPFPIIASSKIKSEIENRIITVVNLLSNSNKIPHFTYHKNNDSLRILKDEKININGDSSDVALLQSENKNILLIINDISHLSIVSLALNNDLEAAYENLIKIHKELDEALNFEFDSHYGYLNSYVRNLANAISFEADISLQHTYNSNLETYQELIKYFNLKPSTNDSHSTINLSQNLKETENEYLENVFQHLYNLHFIEENASKNILIEKSKLNEFDNIKDEKLNHFYQSVKKAYENVFPLYKFTHLYPNNLSLNSLITDVTNNRNNTTYYKQFPLFFHFFLHEYRKLNIEQLIKLNILKDVRHNMNDFRDSLIKLNHYSFEEVKRINLVIRRNIVGFNFRPLLNDNEKIDLSNILTEKLNNFGITHQDFIFEHEILSNTFNFMNKQIKINLADSDHLIYELNLEHEEIKPLVNVTNLIKTFFEIYNKVSYNLELSNIPYLSDPHAGFLTNDIKYLGTGTSSRLEIFNNGEYILNQNQTDDGFEIAASNYSTPVFAIQNSLNVNNGIFKVFNVYEDIFKKLNISTLEQLLKNKLSKENIAEEIVPVEDNLKNDEDEIEIETEDVKSKDKELIANEEE